MIFPIEFYVNEAQSRVEYTRTFTGNLDVNRVISGEPCWVMPLLPLVQKPKKLVLADWTAAYWSRDKITAVRGALNTLLERGFSLYIWQSGQVEPLTKDNFDAYLELEYRRKITPAHAEDVLLATIEQHPISRAQLHVVDDYWLQNLLNQDFTAPRSIVSDIFLDTIENNVAKMRVLKQAMPPLSLVVQPRLKSKRSDVLSNFSSFPGVEIKTHYKSIYVLTSESLGELEKFLQQPDINDESLLTILGETLTLKQFKEIERYTFSCQAISSSSLQCLLCLNPNIKQLCLNCIEVRGGIRFPASSLLGLEELDISCGSVDAEIIDTILSVSPHLKMLKWVISSPKMSRLNLAPRSLFELEEVMLSSDRNKISIEILNTLLAAAPNLKQLDLSLYRSNNFEMLHLSPQSLVSMEKIILPSSISAENVQALVAAAPNLKRIDLSSTENSFETLHLSPQSLMSLEEIKLPPKFTTRNLQELLKAAPNLRRLDLSHCEESFRSLLEVCEPKKFTDGASLDEILAISHAAPTFKRIELSCLKLEDITLPRNASQLDINIFMAIAPNIKRLNCLNARICDVGGIQRRLLTLKEIKWEVYSDSNISTLVKAAPNLTTLDLCNSDWSKIDPEIVISENLLALKKLYLPCFCNMGDKALSVLLEASPNLKEFNCASASGTTYPHLVKSLLAHENINWETCRLPLLVLKQLSETAPHNHPYYKKWIDQYANEFAMAKKRLKNNSILPSVDKGQLVDPVHAHTKHKKSEPTKQDTPFVFHGDNPSKNQRMIIEKLSQYLTLTKQHVDLIYKLQDGICNALTHSFFKKNRREWDQFMDAVSAWNGGEATLSQSLKNLFNDLYQSVEMYQFHSGARSQKQYLGDNRDIVLQQLTINETCILTNPWHAIAVRRVATDRWEIYDPNYVAGVKEVNATALSITIQNAIGDVVAMESSNVLAPAILNRDSFLEKGGLISICTCANAAKIIDLISVDKPFSKSALDGLLLRTTGGTPAWVVGIQSPNPVINQLTQSLLMQFRQQNPMDGEQQLQKSMEVMSAVSKHELITRIVQTTPSASNGHRPVPEARNALLDIIRSASNKDYFEQQLSTWKKDGLLTGTLDEYCQQAVNSMDKEGRDTKKQLIEVDSADELDNLRYALQRYCERSSRPVFYVDKPEDLICLAPFVHRNDDNTGQLQKGPGGPLYDFLQAHQQSSPPPVLIVNYERFKADDIVRFNALLDKERRVDGQLVPANTKIIGLLNIQKPDCYQGADFYSRFDTKGHCPFSGIALEEATPKLSPILDTPSSENGNKTVINLYHSSNWENRLFGRWVIHQGNLVFEEGLLQQALRSGLPIEIQNGLWEDEQFQRSWTQIRRGSIRYSGQTFSIPKNLPVSRSDGYDWPTLKERVLIQKGLSTENFIPVLNPGCMNDFFDHYDWDNEHQRLIMKTGIIESFVKTDDTHTLHVNVTSTLTDDSWAMILDECNRHQCRLVAHCAPGVAFPAAIEQPVEPVLPVALLAWAPNDALATQVIASSDSDVTLSLLTNSDTKWNVIDVSECKPCDLLWRLDANLNQEALRFDFNQTQGALYQAIANHQNVILKGRFSPELADALAPLLLKRQGQESRPNRLVILSDKTAQFAYHPELKMHQVTPEEKIDYLRTRYPENNFPGLLQKLLPYVSNEPISHVCARAAFLKIHPELSSDDAWKGMHDLPGGVHLSNQVLTLQTCQAEADADAFTASRRKAVNDVLEHEPYVFLTGLSGVGKTTFVEKNLCAPGDVLYSGEQSMRLWATTENHLEKGRTILFLDEANLSPREWSELEGLFHTPPGILIGGVFYPLNERHKVVFAGNPLSYGDERMLAPFFERHGRAVVFEPLSMAFIYEKSLKPIFENQEINATEIEAISQHILNAYRFICESSQTEVLISPRELQMMALLTLSNYQNNRTIPVDVHASRVVYELGKSLLPEQLQAGFDAQFKPQNAQELPFIGSLSPQFTVTSSRRPIIQLLHERLQLRELRNQSTHLNDDQKYGGLGGITLEGEPGIGKSELVIETLVGSGYEEEHAFIEPSQKLKPFYRLPVNMALTEKKALLSKAFNEGAVVLIDEINSSPMMEHYLNALLMGRNPEAQGSQRPLKPGFMIIGTQNPISMAGRHAMSTALQRRMTLARLPDYTRDEMLSILSSMSVPQSKALDLIEVYEKQRAFAKANRLMPEPCFRDLLRLAQENSQPALETQADSQPTPILPHVLSSCEELKTLIRQVVKSYEVYNQDNCRFSFFHRHGKAGRVRANAFLERIEAINDVDALNLIISEYLQDKKNGNTHPHSFRTMLLNELMTHYKLPRQEFFDDSLAVYLRNLMRTEPATRILRTGGEI
jgi:hypothetical protein